MFRLALSLALALSTTLAGGCDQPATQTLPSLQAEEAQAPQTPGGATGGPLERMESTEIPREPVRSGDHVLALEGPQVIPQTTLHLDSAEADCDGQAERFEWSVTQPEGATAQFQPHAAHPTPSLVANVAGDYTFELHSLGADGAPCAEPHIFLISVVPESDLHIELLWHTPSDPDETDQGPAAGTDLDLHVRHPLATDWFDAPFDCFWFNPLPNWGSLDPEIGDDPGLDLDDTDGAGPENFNLLTPEADADYTVMVHSWNDHGYGDSLATVRVFAFGDLIYESEPVQLTQLDAWEVGTYNLTAGFIPSATDDGEPLVTPNLVTPFHP